MDAGEDHGSRGLASFFGESGERIFDGGRKPINHRVKVERERIGIDKAMSNVKLQSSKEFQNPNFKKDSWIFSHLIFIWHLDLDI